MKIPLATPLRTRVGDTTKDARLKNAYAEVRGDQSVVRHRPSARGGVAVGTGTAQGGMGFNISGTDYFIGFWSDTMTPYTGGGTSWAVGTAYSIGDHVSYGFVDYWALTDHTGSQPPSSDWSEDYVPAVPAIPGWTVGALARGLDTTGFSNNQIAWNGSIYCYLANSEGSSVLAPYTSSDGVNWTKQSDTGLYYTNATKVIIWAGTMFVALPYSAVAGWINATSTDGITWTDQLTSDLPAGATDIAWNGSVMCAIYGAGAYTSTDAINWTYHALPFSCQSITWNGSVFCATSKPGQPVYDQITTSADGITWASHTLPMADTQWYKIKSSGSVICAVGLTNAITVVSSDNGSTWDLGDLSGCKNLTASATLFLAVTAETYAKYKTSTDGLNWTSRYVPGALSTDRLYNTVFGDKFVVTSAGTYVAASTTGL